MNGLPGEGLGSRLRQERERRRITLDSVAENTKIAISLLQGLERGDVSRWPSGIFRRSFIRAYATAIGLDADAIAQEFLAVHPDPSDAVPVEAVATTFSAPKTAAVGAGFRLRIGDVGAAFMRGPLVAAMSRRWAAAALDVGVVVVIGALLSVAFERFWMPLAMTMLGYYVGSIVLLGNTPGVSFFASDSRRDNSWRPRLR